MTRFARVPVLCMILVSLFVASGTPGQENKNARPDTGAAKSPLPVDGRDADRQDDDVVKVETNLVSMPVVVTTRGGEYIPDMRKEEFDVFEDGVRHEVAFFATVTKPFHVVLMLDTSASTDEKMGLIQQAAAAFVEQLQPSDRVKVISFDDEIRELNEFTSDQAELRRAIHATRPGKGTKLYDAMQLALNLLKPVKGRKAVVIFTDGVDYRSDRYNYPNNVRALEESDTIVYPIRYDTRAETERLARQQAEGSRTVDLAAILRGDGADPTRGRTPTTLPSEEGAPGGIAGLPFPPVVITKPRTDPRDPRDPTGRGADPPFPTRRDETPVPEPDASRSDGIGRMLDSLYKIADGYLEDVARVSGGRLVRADTLALLPSAFKDIAAELRTQYSIGYYPSNPINKGGYRKIKVSTSRKGAVVRARPGYTAVKVYKQ